MSAAKFASKPSRKELVAVIQRLQDLIGWAKSAAWNDRDPNRMDNIQQPLTEGFDLCVDALTFEPPHVPK